MDRREFIEKSIAGGAGVTLANSIKGCSNQNTFPQRKLGRADDKLSIVGFGGIIVMDEEQAVANDLVAKAFARGINYYDVAPTYGNAEEKLGPALEPYRKKCFLACKTTQRDKAGATRELQESMQKLKTDYFDLYQLHSLTTVEDVEKVFGPDGAMEVFLRAKKQGKVRYLGFSAHTEKAALLAMENYDFDTILFPLNYVTWHQGNFGPQVVEKAKETNKGILALKSLAHTRRVQGDTSLYKKAWYHPVAIDNDKLLSLALRWTLSLGTTAAIPPGEAIYFPKVLDIAQQNITITPEETKELVNLSKGVEPIFKT